MKWTAKRSWMSWLANILGVILLLTHTPAVSAQSPGTFTATGNMTTARAIHTATLLLDGRVLIVGGDETGTAELFDPVTGTFTPTGNGTTGHGGRDRYGGINAALLSDGRVLIAGGGKSEVYDPATGSFTVTGNMVTNPIGFTATALTNGKVLITGGGLRGVTAAANPELYDPSTGTFSLAGPYIEPTYPPNVLSFGTLGLTFTTATLLSDGKVLISSEPAAELYDPVTNTFSLVGSMVAIDEGGVWGKPTQIYTRTATLMKDGRVLVAGGEPSYYDTGDSPLSRAEVYNPPTGTFNATGSMHVAREEHAATLLPDGTVLITGGRIDNRCTAAPAAELYDPSTGLFSSGVTMTVGRYGHQATRLLDGRVLISGGVPTATYREGCQIPLASAELYTPAVLPPPLVVTDLQFDRTNVVAGSLYSANVTGSNLTSQTFFDVRFTGPGSNDSAVVLNWQRGPTGSHDVGAGIASGSWTINGVRAHEVEPDHTGVFFPVSATITVLP